MGLTHINDKGLPPPALQDNSRKKRVTRFSARWTGLKNRMGAGTAPSTSSFLGNDYVPSDHSHQQPVQISLNNGEAVDEIIVDRVWSEGISGTAAGSEHGATPEKSGRSYPHTSSAEQDSLAQSHGFCATFPPVVIVRWKIWPIFINFFATSFPDASSESRYRQETWFVQKASFRPVGRLERSDESSTARRFVVFTIPDRQLGVCIHLRDQTHGVTGQDLLRWCECYI
jgi:hypothetical protein